MPELLHPFARPAAPLLAGLALVGSLLACSENALLDKPRLDTDDPTAYPTPPVLPDPPPAEPVADAGPDRVYATGAPVVLDGSASYDPDGLMPLTFAWSLTGFPNGSSVQIAGMDTVAPSFTADVAGVYTFDLTVQNSAGVWDSTPASVRIDAEDEPALEPVSVAGPDQTQPQGAFVLLDGNASFDPQGLTPLSWLWQIVQRPAGSSAVLSNRNSPTPTFTADQPGSYAIELVVTNAAGIADSTPDQVLITAYPVVLPPVAHAGIDTSGTVGSPVSLDGNASTDPQGLLPLTFAWSISGRPPGSTATFLDASARQPVFTPDQPGQYLADLTVMNSAGLWDPTPDQVAIQVGQLVIQEPVANAGVDFGVHPLDMVTLDGSASYDPAGLTPLTWQWTLTSSPPGSTATLIDGHTAHPEFFADLAGTYVAQLTVQNSAGVWDTTPDQVTVEAVPVDGFYVQVSWDNTNDLDLHILNGSTPMWGDGDVCYCNRNPSWGAPGPHDDPELDHDAIYGYGPETTTIDDPAAGNYTVLVHYYGLNGYANCSGFSTCPVSNATVDIYLGGALAQSFTGPLSANGQVWTVAEIAWPSGQITPVNAMSTTSQNGCY